MCKNLTVLFFLGGRGPYMSTVGSPQIFSSLMVNVILIGQYINRAMAKKVPNIVGIYAVECRHGKCILGLELVQSFD